MALTGKAYSSESLQTADERGFPPGSLKSRYQPPLNVLLRQQGAVDFRHNFTQSCRCRAGTHRAVQLTREDNSQFTGLQVDESLTGDRRAKPKIVRLVKRLTQGQR
jgi:hypothetical protein